MGKRAVLVSATLATLAVASACTSPPEPAVGSPAPALERDAIAYDNLDFRKSRPPVFDNTCKTLPQNITTLLGLTTAPRTGFGNSACIGKEEWGEYSIAQYKQSDRKSEEKFFSDVWTGDDATGRYFERLILAERYYAVQTLGYDNASCDLVVDTGSSTPFKVTIYVPDKDAEVQRKLDEKFDPVTSRDRLCPRAREFATKVLAAIDPDGGSRKS
ncbi:hypothetical protein [Crossiella cryophila]|uniref:DUF3558 domain-containing protein n=1 Tax=Crossiella cryophila TaxID=43355 RepID=A0A7W7C9A6_9PSEU|nr:hypothetical protein [Crossiella cryophila]MBB4675529.1 hypothetical protein [Crossiella cryophila]